ncbi:unnamed protein product [Anisakis simplex]|uniref:PH domain-containing protein n=1 Tax=Anisakis simplex TaxID=6269 RepID=A0A0M3JUB2_ANISI|nr:unnamed protein product [Anisakis simplex]
MKTKIPLEELLHDSPQNRTLIRLFEEDTYNLRIWSHELDSALNEWCNAQKVANVAASHLCDVISSYRLQKLPLDVASYDIPTVTGRVSQNLNEIISWMELLVQQVGFCVQTPVKKAIVELDELVETMRPDYADALSSLADAEDRWARASRKDAARRLEELNNDVFITRMGYHKARFISFDAFKKESLTSFLTQAQHQMLTIGKEAEKDKEECSTLLQSLSDLSKSQKEMYYGEKPEYVLHQHQQECVRVSESVQKQGYLRIRLYVSLFLLLLMTLLEQHYYYIFYLLLYLFVDVIWYWCRFYSKSGLFTNNWEKYYVFTQGAKLMWQKADQLGGSLMIDLTAVPGTSAQIASDGVDRRFVFAICLPPSEDDEGEKRCWFGAGERKWLMQARNSMDMYEWIEVINNLAGMQHKISEEQPKEMLSKGAVELLKDDQDGSALVEHRKVDSEQTEKANKDSTVVGSDRSPPTTKSTFPSSVAQDVLAAQPIQFDLLSIGSDSQTKPPHDDSGGKLKEFDVRFLGCLEVMTDEGGDAIVQPAIEHLLRARRVHSIVESCALKMCIVADECGVFLVDREQTDNVKAHFDFADIAFWSSRAGDDQTEVSDSTDDAHQERIRRNMIMAMVTRTRTDKTSRPTFMCCVLASDDEQTTAAEICRELTNAWKKSVSDTAVNVGRVAAAAAAKQQQESSSIRDAKGETISEEDH